MADPITRKPQTNFAALGDENTERHSAYLRGEPLSEEHAALRDGRETPSEKAAKPRLPPIDNPGRDLTISERAALRELRLSDGWPVLLRLQEKIVQIHKAGAISRSQQDPLSNAAAIAEEWAYLTMFQRGSRELVALITAEVEREEER